MDSDEKWYSVKEFAYSLSVGRDTVIRWIKRGQLRAFSFPVQSNRRKRKYVCRRISEAEKQRFLRTFSN